MQDLYIRMALLEKKLDDTVRYGVIKQIKIDSKMVVVELSDNLESLEMPYLVNGSGNANVYFIPKVGDQVVVVSKNGCINQGFVLPNIYREGVIGAEDEWRIEFSQGSIKYNGGKLEINSDSEVTVVSKKVHIDAEQIILADESGGGVVCQKHTCAFTGTPHPAGSSKVKGIL